MLTQPHPLRFAGAHAVPNPDPGSPELRTERLVLRVAQDCHSSVWQFFVSLAGDTFIIGTIQLRFEPGATEACKGTWIHDHFQGRGFATEANREVLRYAFQDLKLRRVFTNLDRNNAASIRVQQKLGMRHEGSVGDAEIYALLSTDWRIQRGGEHGTGS